MRARWYLWSCEKCDAKAGFGLTHMEWVDRKDIDKIRKFFG